MYYPLSLEMSRKKVFLLIELEPESHLVSSMLLQMMDPATETPLLSFYSSGYFPLE